MNRIGRIDRVPYLGVSWGDMYVPLGLSGGVLVVGSFAGIRGGGIWALVVGAVAGGWLLVRASPGHIPTWTWMQDMWTYLLRPAQTYSTSADADPSVKTEGGLANKTPFVPRSDERTEDYVGVERAWPGAGAILRPDGRMEAMIEIEPTNMDFAMPAEWRQLQQHCRQFANETLPTMGEFKLHATTHPFDVDDLVDRLDGRLHDDDVRERPVIRDLIREYRNRRPEAMAERGTNRIRFYVVVTVAPSEVSTAYLGEKTPLEKLAETPLLGLLFSPFVTRTADLPRHERHEAMFETLEERTRAATTGLVQDAPGWSARRLSTLEMVALGARFWNGDDDGFREVEQVVRETPAMQQTREEQGDRGNRPTGGGR